MMQHLHTGCWREERRSHTSLPLFKLESLFCNSRKKCSADRQTGNAGCRSTPL
jgi:hypothetical protein